MKKQNEKKKNITKEYKTRHTMFIYSTSFYITLALSPTTAFSAVTVCYGFMGHA